MEQVAACSFPLLTPRVAKVDKLSCGSSFFLKCLGSPLPATLLACLSTSVVPAQGQARLVFLCVEYPHLLTAEPLHPLLGIVALDGLSMVQLHRD